MSKFDEKISFYKENMVSMGLPYEDELFDKITKGLGPSIFKRDAASVSISDEKEVFTVKHNFLINKLGLEDGEYLEWANVHENFYGELKAPLFDAMKEGLFPLLVLDVQGYFQIRENIDYDKLCSIFILPPNQRELVRRIRNRGEMSDKDLEIRLENSRNECAVAGEFKYCLTNDNLDVTYSILKFIMEREMMG